MQFICKIFILVIRNPISTSEHSKKHCNKIHLSYWIFDTELNSSNLGIVTFIGECGLFLRRARTFCCEDSVYNSASNSIHKFVLLRMCGNLLGQIPQCVSWCIFNNRNAPCERTLSNMSVRLSKNTNMSVHLKFINCTTT